MDVFADFDWDAQIGHPQKTFVNYKSLSDYVRRNTKHGRQSAIILTNQLGKEEGCRTDHATHSIFIVNIITYKSVANNDAAGAYFAWLRGSPIIDPRDINEEAVLDLLVEIGSRGSIGEWIKRHRDRLTSLISEITVSELENAATRRLIKEIAKRLISLSPSDIEDIIALLSSPHFPTAPLQAASLARRQTAVAEFEQELTQNKWLEADWQHFFKRERWIFGHGLLYQFLESVEDQANVGGTGMSKQGGRIVDYAVRTRGEFASFIALVEIKVPNAKIVGRLYRNRTHGMHDDLSGALSQVLGMCDDWNREGSLQKDNIARAIKEGWETVHPRGILVIGHTKQLDSEAKLRSFELFRRQLHGVEILTFDELLLRARDLVAPE